MTLPDDFSIEVSSDPDGEDLGLVGESLAAFNEADVGPANREPLAVFVRDGKGAVVAGISGYTAWGWLYVQWLWVRESLRGRRVAGRMLDAAEKAAAERGCHGAYIDTFSPVALKTYMRQGYEPFGAMDDFPKGRTRTFLQKRLQGARCR
jgi:GNAT superfamily N-acetyltransferase